MSGDTKVMPPVGDGLIRVFVNLRASATMGEISRPVIVSGSPDRSSWDFPAGAG
jgi:hypothetical protein